MPDGDPLFWPVAALVDAFRSGELSPVAVAAQALERIEQFDAQLNSFLALTPELALSQAREAERRYRGGEPTLPPLLGVPVSIKDVFDVRGEPTSLGSLIYRGRVAPTDSEPVARLREAGVVFIGKTNTAEFGQSAVTHNLLGPPCTNPWNPRMTAGGSSGGAAASVGAGLASVALGSDGGGSIRIPAAFCGLVGVKPTLSATVGSDAFRAMTDFVCAGPLARTVADARLVLEVLLGRPLPPGPFIRRRIAWCPAPEGRPVDARVRRATAAAVKRLEDLGHEVDTVALPIEGWADAFGPLVLADEWRFRRHLLEEGADGLTTYVRKSLEAAQTVTEESVAAARALKDEIRERVTALFARYDLIVTPTTATLPFPTEERPTEIDGETVSALWGPFPFTAPFNVSGSPAVSLPVGVEDGLPVGLQLIAPDHAEGAVLDVCEQLEHAIDFPTTRMAARWRMPATDRPASGTVRFGAAGGVAVLRIERPDKRNALTRQMLAELRLGLSRSVESGASAVILTGDERTFSAGMDLEEIGHGEADLEVDRLIAETAASIRALPLPVIAAIEGPCFGAAADLAFACDVRILGDGARFAVPAVKLGILYRPEGIADMVASVGDQTVSRLLLLGEQIAADEAVVAGLAARVVPAGHALDTAKVLARGAAGAPAQALAATKAVIRETAGQRPDLSSWDQRRRELLLSDERASSLQAARAALGAGSSREQ